MNKFISTTLVGLTLFTITATTSIAQGAKELLLSQVCLTNDADDVELIKACQAALLETEIADATRAEMYDNLGGAFYGEDNFEDAITAYQKAMELDPSSWIYAKNLGWSYWEVDKYEQAVVIFNKSLEIAPKSVSYRGKASSLSYLDRHDEALDAIFKAMEIVPLYRRNMLQLGKIYVRAGRNEEAIDAFNALLLEHPTYVYGWANKGDILLDMERYEDAIKQFKMAVLMKPENRYYQADLGWSYWGDSDYDKALESFNAALEIERNANALAGKASTLSFLDRHTEAMELINQSIEIESDDIWNLNEKGWIFYRAEAYEEATVAFDEALKIDPEYGSSWYGKAQIYVQDDNYAKALEMIGHAIEADPGITYLHRRVYYLRSLEYNGQAAIAVDEYLKEFPHQFDLVYQKMWTYYDIHRIDEGVAYIQDEIKNDPENIGLIEALVEFSEETKRWQNAIDATQKIVDLDEAEAENHRDLAWYHLKLDQHDACIKEADNAVRLSPEWSIGYYYRATCNLKLGDAAEAYEQIKTSVLKGLSKETRDEFVEDFIEAGSPIYATRLAIMRIRDEDAE